MFGGSKSSMPYLKIVCVWPPQTSMILSGCEVIPVIFSANVRARSLCLYSSKYFIFRLQQRLALQKRMRQIPHDVIERDVRLLNSVYARRGHDQTVIEQAIGLHLGHPAAIAARKTDRC